MEIAWLPHWLSSWADAYGVGRNVLAFGVLGMAVFTTMGTAALRVIASAVFATGLEVAQLWIPERHFDWRDIVASLGGLVIAWAIVAAVKKLTKHMRAEMVAPQVRPCSVAQGRLTPGALLGGGWSKTETLKADIRQQTSDVGVQRYSRRTDVHGLDEPGYTVGKSAGATECLATQERELLEISVR